MISPPPLVIPEPTPARPSYQVSLHDNPTLAHSLAQDEVWPTSSSPMHSASTQAWKCTLAGRCSVQTKPALPQLAGSLLVFTQRQSAASWTGTLPGGHSMVPLRHRSLAGAATPQAPQLRGSRSR